MEKISRRSFLGRTGTGATALGLVAALPGVPLLRRAIGRRQPQSHTSGVATPSGRPETDALVVHVPDPRSGRLHLMFGTREVVHHDAALVEQLVRAAS